MKGVPDGTVTFVWPAGSEGVAEATLHFEPRALASLFPPVLPEGPTGLGIAVAEASVDSAARTTAILVWDAKPNIVK